MLKTWIFYLCRKAQHQNRVKDRQSRWILQDRLKLSAEKTRLQNPFITERIGVLCRGRDYGWIITDDTLKEHTIKEYYNRFIHNDIGKATYYLKGLSDKKEQSYK